jgi:hypothetical protein
MRWAAPFPSVLPKQTVKEGKYNVCSMYGLLRSLLVGINGIGIYVSGEFGTLTCVVFKTNDGRRLYYAVCVHTMRTLGCQQFPVHLTGG